MAAPQKLFVDQAFRAYHENRKGARLALADQVGLGETLQSAMTAKSAAVSDDGPVLALCPGTLCRADP